MNTNRSWHVEPLDRVESLLEVDVARGLDAAEVVRRRERHGANALPEARGRPRWRMVADQFTDFMIVVLVAAAVVSGLLGERGDALVILAIVVLNAVFGAFQEYRADRALAALRKMAQPMARVRRAGAVVSLPAVELVPGDVVVLEAGDAVPADLRLTEAASLEVDESVLTGEALTVTKTTAALEDEELAIGDRRNMAYRGTLITRGHGSGLAIATGADTELGRIARLLREARILDTPLTRRLRSFGQRLALVVLGLCAVIFAAGLLRGEPAVLMFLTAISLAVAAVPEALPAVVTIALAMGARKMASRRALIRRLPAAETLGSVTVICADKTGTLTENRMTVERLWVDDQWQRAPDLEAAAGRLPESFDLLLKTLALNSEAVAAGDSEISGEPTEVALATAARQGGFDRQPLEVELPRIGEIPFDSERKRMTTLHREGPAWLVLTKGAPEVVLPLCRRWLQGDKTVALDHDRVLTEARDAASSGRRVLAFAYRRIDAAPVISEADGVEQDLTLLGFAALADPLRDGVKVAVADCRSAGVVPVMITGDHPATAQAVAAELELGSEDEPLTGPEIAELAREELRQRVLRARVCARVSPEQKLEIVEALQQGDDIVAMTGDGVNDAPALRRADIGVAMGERGTEVAREAAEMVLLDDNFSTIVSAVEEGRRIFDNIRKFIRYTLTSNSGEIWTLLLAPFLGLPLPLLPVQILWINLVTDGLPGLAFAAEPAESGVMSRSPRPLTESIFARGLWQHALGIGLLIGFLSLSVQAWAYHGGLEVWQTMVFTVLTFCQLVHALVIRSERDSLFTLGLRSNLPLLFAVLLTVGLQLGAIYLPVANTLLHTRPLTPSQLAICGVLPLLVFLAVELEKVLYRRLDRRRARASWMSGLVG